MRKIILSLFAIACLITKNATAQSWSALGEGIGISPYYGEGWVASLAFYNGELYAGGNFNSAGGVAVKGIAKWNGVNWSAVGAGLELPGSAGGPVVNSLTVYNGELYAAGTFSLAGGTNANNIAKWNGTRWSPVGTGVDDFIYSLAVYNGELYVASLPGVSRWNGIGWSDVEAGLYSIIPIVNSLVVHNGALYAAGNSGNWGGDPEYYEIAKWDGTTWTALNFKTCGPVHAMASYNGDLYAAGEFSMTGDTTINQIAKWNGVSWSNVGSGIDLLLYDWGYVDQPADGYDATGCYYSSSVKSLAVYDGMLYAGGKFSSAGGVETRNIAKWDGTNWSAVGLGTNAPVQVLFAADTSLYAAGSFDTVNWNLEAIHIAKWTTRCKLSPGKPQEILGDTVVCLGSTHTYTVDPVVGAAYYTWQLPSGWTGNSLTNMITTDVGTNDGTISVFASNSCGNSEPQTLPVAIGFVIPPVPGPINGNTSVCEGSTQTYFIDPVPGMSHYVWYLPAGWIGSSGTTSITATAGSRGGDIYVGAVADGCGVGEFSSVTIQLNTIPLKPDTITGNIYVTIDQQEKYSIPANSLASYTWSLNGGGAIVTGQNTNSITVMWKIPGDYELAVKGSNSCGTGLQQRVIISVGEADGHDPYEINLFPNPTPGELYVHAKRTQGKMIKVDVVNMLGQLVYKNEAGPGSSYYTTLLDLHKLAPGIYAVKVMVDSRTFTRTIVKK